jgi:hypothetical protein
METMREGWTDERLDDLKESVGDIARRMDAGFAESRMEAASIRREMREGFQAVDVRFNSIDARFDALQRTIIQVGGGMAAAFFAALIGLIATQL